MGENRWRRTWFPDEQVAPDRVLRALKTRRQIAEEDAKAWPWMGVADIGLSLSLITLPASMERFHDRAVYDPHVVHRLLPRAHRWSHPVAHRDVCAALRHYESTGEVIRLPHPLATWGVYVAPYDVGDALDMMDAWAAMDEAREQARHAQRTRRLALGRTLIGRAR